MLVTVPQRTSPDHFMKENLTDIICIGAQKASTSWLHYVISAHPKVQTFKQNEYTASDKEAHFWDWSYELRGIEWYKELMKVDEGRLSADFTPEYALIKEKKVKECKKYSPSAKVIYVLREPVCRAISALRMYMLRDGKDENFILEYGDYFLKAVKESQIVGYSEYFKHYSLWKKYYNDMMIINYEDIIRDKAKVVDNLYKYLNLDFGEMTKMMREELDRRMQERVWKSTEFEVSRDCKMFLDGMLHRNRDYFETYFGFTFEEHKNLLLEKSGKTRKKKGFFGNFYEISNNLKLKGNRLNSSQRKVLK